MNVTASNGVAEALTTALPAMAAAT